MRKSLVIALGLVSLGAIVSVQPAGAAYVCKWKCDQWANDNQGHYRCFSEHQVCEKTGSDLQTKLLNVQKHIAR